MAQTIEALAPCMSRNPHQEVIVLDLGKKFLEYTNPGMARRLLKERKAKVFSQNPFAIMLLQTVPIAEIRRHKTMASPRNFTEYFKTEHDVYVQNMADAQVSCEFPIAPDVKEGFLFPPTKDPINLTQHIPFSAIKQSMDFRKMLSRRPPALQLLDEKEFQAYFAKKAKSAGMVDTSGKPDVDAAIDASEDKRRRTADRNTRDYVTNEKPEPMHEVIEKGSDPSGLPKFGERQRVASTEGFVSEEIINPRVLHLCNQVKAELEDEQRMSAKDLLDALQQIPSLKMDDLEHVRAHGYYNTVKKWSKQQMAELATAEEETHTDAK